MDQIEDVAQVIELTGFDEAGEPELGLMRDGQLYLVFNFMPPSDCEDEQAFDSFDEELAQATGVEVEWEDREVFIIASPKADTQQRITVFSASYRRNLGLG